MDSRRMTDHALFAGMTYNIILFNFFLNCGNPINRSTLEYSLGFFMADEAAFTNILTATLDFLQDIQFVHNVLIRSRIPQMRDGV